jgi:hypothetical protein
MEKERNGEEGLLDTAVVAYGPSANGPFAVIHPLDFKGPFRR